MFEYLKNLILFFYYLIFHFAFVWNSKIGKNVVIREGVSIYDSEIEGSCYIGKSANVYGAKIGYHSKIGAFVEIQGDVEIGWWSVVSSHSFLCSGVKIGNHVFVGHGVMTLNDKFPIVFNKDYKQEKILVDNFASIGSSCTLMGGIKIGMSSMLGANSFLNKDLPSGQLWYGSPAVFKRTIFNSGSAEKYREKLETSIKLHP